MALHFTPATTNMPIATTKVAVYRSQPILNSSRLKYWSPEDESSKLLLNFGNYLPIDTASYSRTLGIFRNADVRTLNLATYVNNIFGQRISINHVKALILMSDPLPTDRNCTENHVCRIRLLICVWYLLKIEKSSRRSMKVPQRIRLILHERSKRGVWNASC